MGKLGMYTVLEVRRFRFLPVVGGGGLDLSQAKVIFSCDIEAPHGLRKYMVAVYDLQQQEYYDQGYYNGDNLDGALKDYLRR